MDKDELIEKVVDMIFDQVVDLNDPQETIRQIKDQTDKHELCKLESCKYDKNYGVI